MGRHRCWIAIGLLATALLWTGAAFAQGGGNLALGKPVTASSSAENWGWYAHCVTDGEQSTVDACRGWTSWDLTLFNHTEWVQVDLESVHQVRRVVLYPRDDGQNSGYGFPVNFRIELSQDGSRWTRVVDRTNEPLPSGPQAYAFDAVEARYVKVTGTNLRSNPHDRDNFTMQFSEIEVYAE